MAAKKRKKCGASGKFCWAMEMMLDGTMNNERVKGLSALVLMNLKTGDERLAGVRYRRSARDKGVLLNYCPWCGVKIDWVKKKV